MNASHYSFALFVFLLVLGAIWFYARMAGKIKAKDKANYAKEQKLYNLYQDIEDLLKGFELYVEESKSEIDARLSLLQVTQVENVTEGNKAEPVVEKNSVASTKEEDAAKILTDNQKDATKALIEDALIDITAKSSEKDARQNSERIGPQKSQPRKSAARNASAKKQTRSMMEKTPEGSAIQLMQHETASVPATPAVESSNKELIMEYAAKGMAQREIAKKLGTSQKEVALLMEIKKLSIAGGQG